MKMVNACLSLQKSNKKEFSIKNVFFTWGEVEKEAKRKSVGWKRVCKLACKCPYLELLKNFS